MLKYPDYTQNPSCRGWPRVNERYRLLATLAQNRIGTSLSYSAIPGHWMVE